MARLVAVCRSDDYPFERRQIPLVVDDNLTMVIQLNDTCMGCHGNMKPKEMDVFVQRFHALTSDEVAVALMVTNKEVMSTLSQMVPCVGCRRSVEKLFIQLVETGHPALEPLVVTPSGILSIKHDYLFDPKAIYALFYVHGSRLNVVMDSIPKSKKNKRCNLHSLDSHKSKVLGGWIDIWDVLSSECRDEVVLIECDALKDTLENYLRKHRFCSECKSKVLRAYNILVGDLDRSTEKGYCPALYEGLKCCTEEGHIHVPSETDFIAHLISRAEPELSGSALSRRERHAKTLDIAQEEVLTCLGIHLYERLSKIWQKLRAEEQTWQILFYLGVDTLRKNFEVALEKKQGISNLELMCQELLNEEIVKQQKREQKRQKKKKKKTSTVKTDDHKEDGSDFDLLQHSECKCLQASKDKENCKFDANIREDEKSAVCVRCDGEEHSPTRGGESDGETCSKCDPPQKPSPKHPERWCRSDCGYSSGHEGCETCSNPSSNDGSDIACIEGVCNHDGDSPLCHQNDLDLKVNSHSDISNARQHKCLHGSRGSSCSRPSGVSSLPLSLEDMLEASCSSGDEDDCGISEEEIQALRAKQKQMLCQRQELRKTLRQRFDNLQHRNQSNGSTSPPPSSPCPRLTSKINQLSIN